MIGRGQHEPQADAAIGRSAIRPWPLTALALLLLIAEPLGIAFYASSTLTRVIDRGPWAVLLLVVRLAITGVGVGAGLALWHRRPGAVVFARVAVALTCIGVLLTFLSPAFPSNRPPGTAAPWLGVLLIYYGAWLTYLVRIPQRAS